jgi:hypothetical protein
MAPWFERWLWHAWCWHFSPDVIRGSCTKRVKKHVPLDRLVLSAMTCVFRNPFSQGPNRRHKVLSLWVALFLFFLFLSLHILGSRMVSSFSLSSRLSQVFMSCVCALYCCCDAVMVHAGYACMRILRTGWLACWCYIDIGDDCHV